MPASPTPSKAPPVILIPVDDPPPRLRRFGVAAVVLLALGILWLGIGLMTFPRRDPMPNTPPRIVIALGAGARDDSTPSAASMRRLETATTYAKMYNAGIVTTRAFGKQAERRMITEAGLADRWTALPNHITNTRDEALAMHMVVADTQAIAVVTSPLHTRRACATFEHVGYRVTCIASAQDEWWRMPYLVAYETAAFVKYKQRNWW